STDEADRAGPFQAANDRPRSIFRYRFPLLEVGWNRDDCISAIRHAGLPIPPKSGCWCCPYTSGAGWVLLHDRHPDLFREAERLERRSRMKSLKLHRNIPLAEVVRLWEPRVRAGVGKCGGGCDASICGL